MDMRRGQAFEVFRLLIAAVVAVVILMVLMQVINLARAPSTTAKDAIKRLIQQYVDTGGGSGADVVFRKGDVVSVSGIAEALGYSSDLVCVLNGTSKIPGISQKSLCGSAGFSCDTTNKTITYNGTQKNRKARVYVYCGPKVCDGTDNITCGVTVLPQR